MNACGSNKHIQACTKGVMYTHTNCTEPDENSTLTEKTSQNGPDLLTAVWCLVGIVTAEGIALAVCVTLIIMARVKWRKIKNTQQLKSRQYKKAPSTEVILPPPPSNHSIVISEPPTFSPPIPMRVMYNNSLSSQLNSSYSIEQLSTQEEDQEELDYDNIVDSD